MSWSIKDANLSSLLQIQYVYEDALSWHCLIHDERMELVMALQEIDQLIEEKKNERNRNNDRSRR